jgi:hypothetical protein
MAFFRKLEPFGRDRKGVALLADGQFAPQWLVEFGHDLFPGLLELQAV